MRCDMKRIKEAEIIEETSIEQKEKPKRKKAEINEEIIYTEPVKEKSFYDKYKGIIFSVFITFILCLAAFGVFYNFYLKKLCQFSQPLSCLKFESIGSGNKFHLIF